MARKRAEWGKGKTKSNAGKREKAELQIRNQSPGPGEPERLRDQDPPRGDEGPADAGGNAGFLPGLDVGRGAAGALIVSKISKNYQKLIGKFLQIFGGLVLGCVKTKFCK